MIGYLAARTLSKGSRILVGGLTQAAQQILIFQAHAISSYTGLGSMVLSAIAIIGGMYSRYLTTDKILPEKSRRRSKDRSWIVRAEINLIITLFQKILFYLSWMIPHRCKAPWSTR
jgi:hypothetical protein